VRSRLTIWRLFLVPGTVWLAALFIVPLGLVVAVAVLGPPAGLQRVVRWPAVVAVAALVVGFLR